MRLGKELLYLSRADVVACGVTPAEMNAAVESMFKAKASGQCHFKPKLNLPIADGTFFLGKIGALLEPPFAAIKWLGFVADNESRGLPSILPLIVLNDFPTGMPVALMDGRWITGARTGSISTVAAKYLARPDSNSIGFVACGLQARTHLACLSAQFPIARIVAYSRRTATAQAFAREAEDQGVAAEVTDVPRRAVEGVDIVVTSLPVQPYIEPYLDGGWLSPGAFAAVVDLGRPWRPESMRAWDKLVTDDEAQSIEGRNGPERFNYPYGFYGEIGDLVTGRRPGRATPEERNAVVFSGLALADIAAAALVYERALARGVGRVLAL